MISSLLRSEPDGDRRMIGSSRSAARPCTYCGVTAVSSTTTPAAFALARPAAAPMSSTEAAAARASTATSSSRATSPPATRGPSGRSARACCRSDGGLSGRTVRGRARCRPAGYPVRRRRTRPGRPRGSGAERPLVVQGERQVDGGEVGDGQLPGQAGQPGEPAGIAVLGQPADRDVVRAPRCAAPASMASAADRGSRSPAPSCPPASVSRMVSSRSRRPGVVGPVAEEVVGVARGQRPAEDGAGGDPLVGQPERGRRQPGEGGQLVGDPGGRGARPAAPPRR